MDSENHDKFPLVMEMVKGYSEENKEVEEDMKETKKEVEEENKSKIRKRDTDGKLIPPGKTYAELYREVAEKKKNKILSKRGGMQVVHDANGNLVPTGKTYAEVKKEQKLRKEVENKKKKKKCDSPPREPRWSDVNWAMHIWRGICMRKGVPSTEYELRTDYANMTCEEIDLDLLWRKVYQREAEEDAAAAALATTTTS